MRLDNADLYDKPNAQEKPAPDLHQVGPDNITLAEQFESHHTDMFNHFERFDIEGDDKTQTNFSQPKDAQIPNTLVPPPPQEQAHQRDEPIYVPNSGSGHGLLSQNSVTNSSRSYKKRPNSSSKHSGNGLQPVKEEKPWHDPASNFKLTRLSELPENVSTQDNEILMETGPTQTQHPLITQPLDTMTDSIRIQLKSHFDTPGSAEAECLNELTLGMKKKQAACLFYQTCVLATRDFIKVEQEMPYGNILISRGTKM